MSLSSNVRRRRNALDIAKVAGIDRFRRLCGSYQTMQCRARSVLLVDHIKDLATFNQSSDRSGGLDQIVLPLLHGQYVLFTSATISRHHCSLVASILSFRLQHSPELPARSLEYKGSQNVRSLHCVSDAHLIGGGA